MFWLQLQWAAHSFACPAETRLKVLPDPSFPQLPVVPCSHSTCFITQPHLYWSFGLALVSGSQNASHQTSVYLPKKTYAFPPWAPERKHTDNRNCSVYHKSSTDLTNQQTLTKVKFDSKRLYFSMWEQKGSLKNRASNWVSVCGLIRQYQTKIAMKLFAN